jgi:hypothetical protein
MGYEDGKAIGTPGQFGACEIDGEKFCVKSSKEFVLSELSCKPDDKSLLECGSSDNTDCAEDLTAMAECDGEDGDNSGASQAGEAEDNPKKPLLG